MNPVDPFEQFRAKREVEKLEKKVRSSGGAKAARPGGAGRVEGERAKFFDPDRSWIY